MLLMTPGPVEVDERVIRAMSVPAIPHYHPEVLSAFDECVEMLRPVFGTREGVIALLPGSGRVGMEAAVLSLVEEGDRVLCLINGEFGRWFAEMSRRAGAEVEVLEFEIGRAVDPSAVEGALRRGRYHLLTVVHSETSTGAKSEVREIGRLCREREVICVVDAVSSLGCSELRMEEWGIDVCCSASNKGLGGVMGIAIVAWSKKAEEKMRKRRGKPHTFAFDLSRWGEKFYVKGGGRAYPVIPPPHILFALREALRLLHEEGLSERLKRCRRAAKATREAVRALGLRVLPPEEEASESVTCVIPPEGVPSEGITRLVLERFNIMLGPGIFDLKGKAFRISHMGVQATEGCLAPTIAALERVLPDLGHKVRPGSGLEAFYRVWTEA